MICYPNAKINLGLYVTEKRPDGYHNLETGMYPIQLCDALEVVPPTDDSDFCLKVSGLMENENSNDNLVAKAFHLLKSDFPHLRCTAYLHKVIPFGAGLGGGSSDAAFALRLFSDYFKLNLSIEQLEAYAAQLGSDCPFFIRNRPMLATGTGTHLHEMNLSLNGLYLVLLKPDVMVSTQTAYAGIRPFKRDIPLLEQLKKPVQQWKDVLDNDFESNVFQAHPQLKQLKEQLYQAGAVYASMTGSGSAVYGLFNEAVHGFEQSNLFCWTEQLHERI